MMTDLITFCGYVACYALIKSIVHTLYMWAFNHNKYGTKMARKNLIRILWVTVAILVVWHVMLLTPYADWTVGIATVLCARITWREFKTVFGIREGDWNRYIGELTLIDVVDWCEGIVDVISGKWSLLDIFSCSGDSFYQETCRNDEFYYDARWYYDYGDGKNG